jgi:hypothetical protein
MQVNYTDNNLPEITYFKVSPDNLEKGNSVDIRWAVTDATTIRIEPGIGDVGLEGIINVAPTISGKYTLYAGNSYGNVEKTVLITVAPSPFADNSSDIVPVINYFKAKQNKVWAGAGAKLLWQVSNASSLSIHWDSNELALKPTDGGSVVFYPVVPTLYILIARNTKGSAVSTVRIEIFNSIGSEGSGAAVGGGCG